MIPKYAMTLIYAMAPAAVFAQQVELRSADEFISVAGEIIGYDGVMLQVQTSVGLISVPAAEVICYGQGCNQTITSNPFGLTEGAFDDVISEQLLVLEAAPVLTVETFTIGFEAPVFGTLYKTIAGAYAVASDTPNSVDFEAAGTISIQNDAGNQSATLSVAGPNETSDIVIQAVSLNGTAAAQYQDPAAWAAAAQPTHQLVGLKSFSVVVAPNAGISQISMDDLARIYAGELTNWSQIGGADTNILPLQMPGNSAISKEVMRLVMEPAGKEIAGNVLTMADEAGISASISQFPGSMSIIGTAIANEDLVVDVAGPCGLAVAPTAFNIVTGDYPLVRPIMVTYNAPPSTEFLTELFDFASVNIAQGSLVDEGFLDFDAKQQDTMEKNARLSGLLEASLDEAQRVAAAEMFQVLFAADRISTTFTGGAASGPEGAWNRAMLLDLVDALDSSATAGREIIFVGFGESAAGTSAAIAASAGAAAGLQDLFQEVAADVIASRGYSVSSYGFGNVSPATCVDGQVPGSGFTRIEVWIR